MAKLLNIKLKTKKGNLVAKTWGTGGTVFKLDHQAEITDQNGIQLTQIKNRGPSGGQIQIKNLTQICVDSSNFVTSVSWAWENRGGGYRNWNNY